MISKKLINSPESVVSDAVDGLLMTNSNLKRIGNLNIVARKDILAYRENHVTIISGGGSGHEPAHAGFIGSVIFRFHSSFIPFYESFSYGTLLFLVRECCRPQYLATFSLLPLYLQF